MTDAQGHIEALTGNSGCKVLFVAKDDDAERFKRDTAMADAAKKQFGADWWPHVAEKLEGPYIAAQFGSLKRVRKWLEEKQLDGAGVFILVHENDGTKGRRKENIKAASAVWHEDDIQRKDPRTDFELPRSFAVESSSGKHHTYWVLTTPGELTLDDADGINRRLVNDYDGDAAAKDRSRVLRLAGSWNLKPGREPFQCQLILNDLSTMPLYGADELLKAFPPVARLATTRAAKRSVAPDAPLPMDSPMVRSALEAIRDRCEGSYGNWLEVGMALHDWSGGSRAGLELWQEFCPDPGECEAKWDSFGERDGGVTIGTLFHHAKADAGWTEDEAMQAGLDRFRKALADFQKPSVALDSATPEETRKREAEGFNELVARLAATPGLSQSATDLELKSIAGIPGAPILQALRADFKRLKKEGARQQREARGEFVFPHANPTTGAPTANSLPNVIDWLGHEDFDIWLDEFADTVMWEDAPIVDADLHDIRERLHRAGMMADGQLVRVALDRIAAMHRRHPVKEYMDKAAERHPANPGKESLLDTWLIDYCGAADNQHWRAISRLLMIAIVMRTYQPGCKFDHVLTLVGPEGLNKSALCRVLAIRDEWCLEGFRFDEQKIILEQTVGKLIVEYGEMAGHSQRDQATQKDAISRRRDKARKAYGYYAEERGRSWVPIANTNEGEPLVSRTGNRRFWPLVIEAPINVHGLREVLEQLYGEAVHAQRAYLDQHGTDVVLDEEHWGYFGQLQEQHRAKAVEESVVAEIMDGFAHGHILVSELTRATGHTAHNRYQANATEHAMKQLGWKKVKQRLPDYETPQWCFVKGLAWNSARLQWTLCPQRGVHVLQAQSVGSGKVVNIAPRLGRATQISRSE